MGTFSENSIRHKKNMQKLLLTLTTLQLTNAAIPQRKSEDCSWIDYGDTCPTGSIARGASKDKSLYCCSTRFQHAETGECQLQTVDNNTVQNEKYHCNTYANELKSVYSLQNGQMECCHNGDISVTSWLDLCVWVYFDSLAYCPDSYVITGWSQKDDNNQFGIMCCPFINNPIPTQ